MLCLSHACLHDTLCRNNLAWRHVQKVFTTFIYKLIRISVKSETFQQITLGSGSTVSQTQEPFSFFDIFGYLTYYAGITRHEGMCRRFLPLLFINYLEYLLKTKLSNRLLFVLGVKSPKPKGPFIFLTFLVFPPHMRHLKLVFRFQSYPARIFLLLEGISS